MSIREKKSISQATNKLINIYKIFHIVAKNMPKDQVFVMTSESLIKNPKKIITNLCNYLNLETPQDYLEACSSILFKEPHTRKNEVKLNQKEMKKIKEFMEEQEFLEYFKEYLEE